MDRWTEDVVNVYVGPGIEVFDPDMLTEDLDFVFLPHFLEEIDPKEVLSGKIIAVIMVKRLKYGGKLVLFEGSEAINRAKKALQDCLELEFEERYKGLLLYKKAPYRGKD